MNDYDKAMRISELLEVRVDVLCEIELSEYGQKEFWRNELKKVYSELKELGWNKKQ